MYDHVQILFMTNIRVTIDERTLRLVDRASKSLGLKRSEIVGQALRQWLQRQAIDRFERQWIAALEHRPPDDEGTEDWLGAQAWSPK